MKMSAAVAAYHNQVMGNPATKTRGIIYDLENVLIGEAKNCSPNSTATIKMQTPYLHHRWYLIHNQADATVFSNLFLKNDGFSNIAIASPVGYQDQHRLYTRTTADQLVWPDGFSAIEIPLAQTDADTIFGKFCGAHPVCSGEKWVMSFNVSKSATADVQVFLYADVTGPVPYPVFYPHIYERTFDLGKTGSFKTDYLDTTGMTHNLMRLYLDDQGWIEKTKIAFDNNEIFQQDKYQSAFYARDNNREYTKTRADGLLVVDFFAKNPWNSILNLDSGAVSINTQTEIPNAAALAYADELEKNSKALPPSPPREINSTVLLLSQSPYAESIK